MDETTEEHNRHANQKRTQPTSSSPLSSVRSFKTWQPADSPPRPPWMNDHQMRRELGSQHHHAGVQSSPPSRFFEELFCTSQTSRPLAPLAGALVTSPGPQSDVVKQGYLGKLERSHRRYFVLRAGSHTGPSRLEWYKSQEKFTAMEKSAGKATLFGSSKQGVVYLRCCLGVSRIGGTRRGHTVALYAKDQTIVLVVEDKWEQEEWYLAIRKLMEEERKDEEHGEGFEEEDDGYCTLPPAAFFKEVWPVTVRPRGLGCSKSLSGESRLCLTATSLILVRVGACSDLPSVTIPLLSVRRFGHLDGSFFLELGRSAPNGPGEIWMEARDQGNPAGAQHIHERVRETVGALRALPDFSRSPTSNHSQLQTLLASKRCRPKCRDKQVNLRLLGSRLAASKPERAEPGSTLSSTSQLSPFKSHQSSTPETGGYVEMKLDHPLPLNKEREGVAIVTGGHSVAACGMESWEPGEEEEEEEQEEQERLGYMVMSPQVSHSLTVLPQDDYVSMASPQKHTWPACSTLQTSFNSSTSESSSPLRLSYQSSEHSQPHWLVTSSPVQQSEKEAAQSRMSISSSPCPQDEAAQDQKSATDQTGAASSSSPVNTCAMRTPSVTSGPGCSRPVRASLTSGARQSRRLQAVSDQSVRRYRMSLCLPSCLRAEDGS